MTVLDDLNRLEELQRGGYLNEAIELAEKIEKSKESSVDTLFKVRILKSWALSQLNMLKESSIITDSILTKNPTAEFTYYALIIKSEVYMRLGKFKEAFRILDECNKEISKMKAASLDTRKETALLLNHIGSCFSYTGQLNKAKSNLEQSLNLFKELDDNYFVALTFFILGNVYLRKGDFKEAFESYQLTLEISKENEFNHLIHWSLLHIGVFYRLKGSLDLALEYFKESLLFMEKISANCEIVVGFLNIGLVYNQKGEVEEALGYFQKACELSEKIDYIRGKAISLMAIGNALYQKNDLNESLNFYNECLKIVEQSGTPTDISESLFGLIIVTIKNKHVDEANQYMDRLRLLKESHEDNKLIDQRYKLANALLLKSQPRMASKVRSQEILRALINEEVFDNKLAVTAMQNLSELLLEELKAYNEVEVLEEIRNLIEKIYTIAELQHSFSLVVKTLILKAKLTLIEGNLNQADKILSQAETIAKKNNLRLLAQEVSLERKQLGNQFLEWNELIRHNTSFKERMEHANLIDYINLAKNLMQLNIKQ